MDWFVSDTHYNHKNICRGVSNWESKKSTRDFDTLEEMNYVIVKNINDVVGPEDTLYHLGDWSSWFKPHFPKAFRDQIICQNIHLIYGNHDEKIKNKQSNRELFSSTQDYLEIVVEGQKIILFHYACRVWNGSHRGSWMLYGHSHGTLNDKKPKFPEPTWIGDDYYIKSSKSIDVGIDTHLEFRPYSFKEIKEIMDKRGMKFGVDHH